MIGKIVTGKSFGGAVRYLLGKEPGKAYILTSDGVELTSRQALIGSFEFQRRARPDVERVVGHISLSFHPDDDPRMSNQLMLDLAREYMQRMEITGTQYLVVRHTDTKHPHLHVLYNRVRYDTTLVPDRNERLRNMRICRELKQEYGLTFSHGKEQVATERLHGPEQLRHRIYDNLRELLPYSTSWMALAEELSKRQVATTFVHRGGDPTKEIQGVTFTLKGHTFKASQVDRKFSYGRLTQRIEQNRFRQAMIERVNARDYTREEVEDWASCGESAEHMKDLLARNDYVAALNEQDEIIGFSSMNAEGYLHSLFVHKDYQRVGVGGLLLSAVEKRAQEYGVSEITSEVSLTARPFFEKRDYEVMRAQKRRANRLKLTNFVMCKRLKD